MTDPNKRVNQLEHQLSLKRTARRILLFPFTGWISIILGVASVILGKDIDVVDHVLNKIISAIPVVGSYLGDTAGKKFTLIDNSTGNQFVAKYLGGGRVKLINNQSADLNGHYSIPNGPDLDFFVSNSQENIYRVHQQDKLEDFLGPSGGDISLSGSGGGISLPGLPSFSGGLMKVVFGLGLVVGILWVLTTFFAGAEWAGYLGGQFLDAVIIPANIDPELGFVSQLYAAADCFGDGPDCIRQHQAEMASEPTAEAVGETFQVEIEDFEVGQGGELPVGYRPADDEVSLTFNIYNTRSGGNGIEAYDVQYRLLVIDRDRGHDDPYCDSGWQDIEGNQLRGDEANDLLPGVPAGTGFQRLDEVTIGDCEMQQPGLGDRRTVALQLKYEYSSLGEVEFEVMDEEVFRQDQSITQGSANSEALDTPVQAGVQVLNDPVLFTQNRDISNPISFNAQVESDDRRVEFMVDDLMIEKPELAEIAEEETCDFELVDDNEMRLRDSEKERIIPTEEGIDEYGEDFYWFEDQTDVFGCNLQLTNTDVISETGETFSMTTRTNYTVRMTEEREGFNVYNEACERSGITCPLLVTESFDRTSPYEWRTSCTGRDSGTGCSVIDGETYGDTPVPIHEEELRQGEHAIDPAGFEWQSGVIENYDYTRDETGNLALGLTSEELDTVRYDHSWALTTFGSGNVRRLDEGQCEPDDVDAEGLVAMYPHENC